MIDEVRGESPGSSRSSSSARTRGRDLLAGAERGQPRARWRRSRRASQHRATRSTSSTRRARPGSPRARPSATATSSTTGSSSASCAATPRRTGSASRCPSTTASAWSWATSRAPPTARRWSSRRPVSTRPRPSRRVQDERCTSLYGVPTMFIAEWSLPDFADYDLSTMRTGIMAGSPCPAEMMKKLIARGHRGDDHLLRHDRDLAGLDADPHRRHLRAQGRHRRPGRPAPRDQGRRPDDRRDAAARRAGRVLHQGLLGDARLLGAAGQDRRGPRRTAGCTPATSPSWTRTATSRSPAGSRTWSSAAARTSTRARSRSSSTPTPTSSTPR